MAIVNTRRCDVTGTFLEIKSYRLSLDEVERKDSKDGAMETIVSNKTIISEVLDLSPRGIKRLQKFVDTGLSPMKKIKREKPEEEPSE